MTSEFEQRIQEEIENAPNDWQIWCHPETLHQFDIDCRSFGDPIPQTPKERTGKEFKPDIMLPRGEFFALPESITELKYGFEALEHPPGAFVRELLHAQGINSNGNKHNVELFYRIGEVEHRFNVDKLKEAVEIPVLDDLIKTHHHDYDVTVEDGEWILRKDHTQRGTLERRTLNANVPVGRAVEMFTEQAIEIIGSTMTEPIDGYFDRGSTVKETVGQRTTEFNELYLRPREMITW